MGRQIYILCVKRDGREKIKYSLAMIKIKALRKMVTLSREN